MKPTRLIASALVAVTLAAGAWTAYRAKTDQRPAPDVAFTLLDGSRSSIEQLRGKVVLLNFWATDCGTCLHEMPELIATHRRFEGRGFETLAVSMRDDPPARVIDFAETRRLPFKVVIDNTGEIAGKFGQVRLTPTTLLIDRRGRIVMRHVGKPDFAALDRLIDELLAAHG